VTLDNTFNAWRDSHLTLRLVAAECVLALDAYTPIEVNKMVPADALPALLDELRHFLHHPVVVLSSAGGPDGGPLLRQAPPARAGLSKLISILEVRAGGRA
jgi:hypothetical protein